MSNNNNNVETFKMCTIEWFELRVASKALHKTYHQGVIVTSEKYFSV